MRQSTRIANRDVPLRSGDLVTLEFTAGRGGKDEAGRWEFWTPVDSRAALTARCRPGVDPGKRFREMESGGPPHHWEHASKCTALRPATRAEVQGWLDDKKADAPFAIAGTVGTRQLAVAVGPGGTSITVV